MIILFLIFFIDIVSIGILMPLFPLLKVKFALSSLEVGYITSASALLATFGALLFGMLSDKFGRRYLLILPLLFMAIMNYFIGLTNSTTVFIILKVLAGFFGSHFSVAFASANDITDKKNKFKSMGVMSASIGLGFIVGPLIGGYLSGNSNLVSDINFSFVFNVSAILDIFAVILIFFFFKETSPLVGGKERIKLGILKNIILALRVGNTKIFFLLSITLSSMMSATYIFLGIWLHESFSFTAKDIGFFMAISGAFITIIQFNISKIISSHNALIIGFLFYSIAMFGFLASLNVTFLIVFLSVMSTGIALITPSINSQISLQGNPYQQGLLMGINQSMNNIGSIIGPTLLGFAFNINILLGWVVLGSIGICSVIFIFKFLRGKLAQELTSTL